MLIKKIISFQHILRFQMCISYITISILAAEDSKCQKGYFSWNRKKPRI